MAGDVVVNGLISGGVYALLALGFSLIFGVARILNLGHTAFYMVAAYGVYHLVGRLGLHPGLSALAAVGLTAALGVAVHRTVVAPLHAHETTVLIVTVAVGFLIQELLLMTYGAHYLGAPSLLSGYATVGGVRVSLQHLLSLGVVGAVLAAVWLLLGRTRLGTAIQAVANDREVANLMGIDVPRTETAAMAVSAALAGVAGVIVAPLYVVEPFMWLHPLVIVLAVVVLGGLGSLKGSLLAAFILAFTETLVVFLVPTGSFLRGAVSLAVMLAVLLLRPEGLFGVFVEGER